MRCLLTTTAMLFLLLAPAKSQDFKKGYEAALREDYATALREWRPLAEQGNPHAHYNLGMIYDFGQGVPQDYAEALRWYRLAARQGLGLAQYNLCAMYGSGHGVQPDAIRAHMWCNLAAAQGNTDAIKAREEIAGQMTPEQIVEAQKLARDWKPTKER